MDENMISVIVAVYNVQKYLNRCIESLINQTYPNLEIILVDDESTDSSGIMCDKWAKKDPRIKVIHKINGGLSDARNYGIKAAHGRWIGFVDGDDYISLDMYENLFNNRVIGGIIVCGYYLVKNTEVIPCSAISATFTPQETIDLYLKNEINSSKTGNFTYFGSYAWNKLYDREMFSNILYPLGKKFEDMYIILELIHAAQKIKFIPNCEYYYIQRMDSITHSFQSIQIDSLNARLKQKKELIQFWNIGDERIDRLIAIEYFSILKQYALIPQAMKKKYSNIRHDAWCALRRMGYADFSYKMKLKLFLCRVSPMLYKLIYYIHAKKIIKS
jgi:glycosyltransferase involved in cell wall biosynthesis